MKKRTNAICIVILFSLVIGLISNAIPGLAASAWEFRTKSGKVVQVNGTIQMKKNEFQDFNLFNNNVEITSNSAKYSVEWTSSNTKVIWIDKVNGKARVDKNGAMTSSSGEALVTAVIKNKQTGAQIKRSFTVIVGSQTTTSNVAKLAIELSDGISTDQTLEIGKSYKLKSVTYDKNGKVLTFAQTKLYRTYFGNNVSNGVFKADKEGTYTITVAAYKTKKAATSATSIKDAVITGTIEVTVGSKTPKMTSIKQISLDSVEITINQSKYIEELIKNPDKLVVYSNAGSYQVRNYIKEIKRKNTDNTIIVTMYSQFTEKTVYKFEYIDEKDITISFESANTEPAYIKVIDKECVTYESVVLQIKAYNSIDIEVPISSYYTVTFSAPYNSDYSVSANTIYFFNPDKVARVTATLDGYNPYGQKLPTLQATGTYTSISETTAIKKSINGYAIGDGTGTSTANKLTYNMNTKTLYVGESNKKVYVSYNGTDLLNNAQTKYIVDGTDGDGRVGYTYETSNSSCLLISNIDGSMIAIAQGKADILIMKGTGNCVGVVTVEILPARVITDMRIAQYDNRFSVTKSISSPLSLRLDVTITDQYGNEYDPAMITYTYDMKYPQGLAFHDYFNVTQDGLDIILKENYGLFSIPVGTTQGYNIEITAHTNSSNVVLQRVVTLAVKAVDTSAVADTKLSISKNMVDMYLTQSKPDDYNIELFISTMDAYGYQIGDVPINYITNVAGASSASNVYSLMILCDGKESTLPFTMQGNKLILQPVKLNGNELLKAPVGIYTAYLYKGNGQRPQLIHNMTFSITDSTPKITVNQSSMNVPTISTENIRTALKFYRGGVDISQYIAIDTYDIIPISSVVHVSAIYIQVKAIEINPDWNSSYYTKEKLEIGKTFNVNP